MRRGFRVFLPVMAFGLEAIGVAAGTPPSANTRLLAYRADPGEQLLDVTTGLSQMGPPMTFMLDGKAPLPAAAPASAGR